MEGTLLDLQDELEGRIAEHVLDESVIEVGEDGAQDTSHHPHAHLIRFCLEFQENAMQCVDEIG